MGDRNMKQNLDKVLQNIKDDRRIFNYIMGYIIHLKQRKEVRVPYFKKIKLLSSC